MLQKMVKNKKVVKNNSVLYGILAGLGLLLFYLTIVSIFQGIDFAFLNLRSLWYLIFPLAAGFGTQIGLSGLALFLTAYQKWFLGVGLLSNLIGISIMLKHKKKMKNLKGDSYH